MTNQSEQFWEQIYSERDAGEHGSPNAALARFAADLPIGRALDLGCARGDDAIWLARRGWHVVAVDIAPSALRHAAFHAARAGVAEKIDFQQHDLARMMPDGPFDLVSALFLQSPIDFSRARVLHRAAQLVAPGGLFLVSEHASSAPWSWAAADAVYPTPAQSLAEMELNLDDWEEQFVGAPERMASGPGGQQAMVKDNVVALRRR